MSEHRSGDEVPPLEKKDSKKRMDTGDERRRNRFKERSKNLERGLSAPAFNLPSSKNQTSSPKAPMPLTAEEAVTVGQGMGHELVKKTFFQPTYCHHCSEMLWGIKGQGLSCTVCNFVTHERCVAYLIVPCCHLKADKIQDPVAHKWTKPMTFKKKVYCNVCRRKINSDGVICEVCKYHAHTMCKENSFNDCKRCATFSKEAFEDKHHWIEGNLPSSARCQTCSKVCSSSECLSGFRCGWCGICVHSGCLEVWQVKQPVCNYRQLWAMVLVPKSVSQNHAIHTDLDPITPVSSDDPDCDLDSWEAEDKEDREGNGDDSAKSKQCIIVDGTDKKGFGRWRKNTMHPSTITKATTAAELLSISLRKCGISDDPSEYFLAEMIDSSRGEERGLDPAESPFNVKAKAFGGLIRLYIRHKSLMEEVKGNIRVNNSHLDSPIKLVVVPTGLKTTAAQVVEHALIKFELEDENPTDYCLIEVSQVYGVRERVFDDNECPWVQMQDLRKNSLTLSSRQRYYVRHRTGGETALYLANVPKEILRDEIEYIKYVKDLIINTPPHLLPDNIPYDQITIGPAFPAMGGLVLQFPTYVLATKISVCLEQSPLKPKVIMLPTIYTDMIGVDQEPLLVFVNGKSGGNQGHELLSAFRRHLNPHQVYDLANGGPMPGLFAFRNMGRFRILVGGGDGTFGWVLSALQEAQGILKCIQPPCGLLPLGTGNDLARALNWGSGYSGAKVMQILLSVEDSNIVCMDRWNVDFKEVKLPKETKSADDVELSSIVMNNYMGIGLDAAIALDFHLAREENPEKFCSRFHNKGVYLQLGLQKMISKSDTQNLKNHLNVFVDGKRIEMPEVEGIVFLNIQSWGAGADAWGTSSDPNFAPAALDDGMMELVGISGVMQMGQIQSGVRSGIRIAQGKEFKVDILSTVPIQIDGEAWPQPPSVMTISCLPDKAVMLRGPNKADATFSRNLSKKEEEKKISLLHTISEPELLLSGGMSSRRDRMSHAETQPELFDD